MTIEPSLIVACLSLLISGVTAWLTLFRRGTIKMTQPTTVFFGPDGGKGAEPKVYLRTLLYSTSKRGQIVESMFLRLRRQQSLQTFNIWVYGDRGPALARGSGLYVGQEGVTYNHHFLLPKDGTRFEFLAGDYTIGVYASLVGSETSHLLWRLDVSLTEQQAAALKDKSAGIYFDWGADTKRYHAHIDVRPPKRDHGEIDMGGDDEVPSWRQG